MNMISTLLGLVTSTIRIRFNLDRKIPRLQDIYNYYHIEPNVHTSGQLTPNQLNLLKSLGCSTVIHLGPENSPNYLKNEGEIVEGLGMQYVHMPVDFSAPSEKDYEDFARILDSNQGKPVWIHCAANLRVAGFVYRYRVERGAPVEMAQKDLRAVWKPFGAWKQFVANVSRPVEDSP